MFSVHSIWHFFCWLGDYYSNVEMVDTQQQNGDKMVSFENTDKKIVYR